MTQEYEFDQDDGVHIAQHREDPKKDVRIDSSWVTPEDDEVYAPWEDLVATILSEDITGYIDVSSRDQLGSVDLDQACQNLANGVSEIESEQHAKALIKCFLEEGIVESDNDEIVLFRNISAAESDNPNFLYNWAAAMEMVREKIDQQIKRAEKLEEQLNGNLEDIQSIGEDFVSEDPQEQVNRVDQKLRALGEDNGKVPRNPEELSPEEYNEYQQYRKTFRIARSRLNIQENITVENPNSQAQIDKEDVMQGEIQNFQELQQAFVEYERTLRMTIEYNEWDDNGVSELLDGLVDMLSGVAQIDQSLEDEDPEEIDETLKELRDSRDAALEGKQQLEDGNADLEGKSEEVKNKMEDRSGFDGAFE